MMDQERLIKGLDLYRSLEESDPERSRVFRDEILPFTENMINGVFLSLRIHHEDEEFLKDLKQHLYLLVIPGFEKENKGIRSIKNYLYMKLRNATVNYLIDANRRKAFKKKIKGVMESEEVTKEKEKG